MVLPFINIKIYPLYVTYIILIYFLIELKMFLEEYYQAISLIFYIKYYTKQQYRCLKIIGSYEPSPRISKILVTEWKSSFVKLFQSFRFQLFQYINGSIIKFRFYSFFCFKYHLDYFFPFLYPAISSCTYVL